MQMKIYLIINERIMTQTLKEFLTNLKYEVLILNSISELLNICKKKPELKGLVIIEENTFRGEEKAIIRKIHKQYSNIFFIVITATTPDFSIEEAIAYGIYGYLHKPISLLELELLLVRLNEKRND
jgi:DNA-binding NtrC family response regulator